MKHKYNHKEIEAKWQARWDKDRIYTPDISAAKNPFYNLWMFPYPSAEGLHAGHAFASTGSDVFGRFMRMHGHDVFQPIGYDSFGIHSENYAIKVGEAPSVMLQRTTVNYERQLRSLGHGYDWTRTVTTSHPDYYVWTQWLFVQLFKSGLAYRREASVNWCPSCKTVLADEQVIDGKCERCGTVVEKKSLAQWFFRITDYADRLLDNLDGIEWTEKVKQAQKQWIGRAEGLSIHFAVQNSTPISVWTRYWETIFGATFLVVSPEYLIEHFSSVASAESLRYAQHALEKTADERRTSKEKTGEDTGIRATNPVTQEVIPVWVADYVIEGVGTGAVMGVPSHDTRDFDFAKKYGLALVQVISYPDPEINEAVKSGNRASEQPGTLMNSGEFNGLDSAQEGKDQMRAWLIKQGLSEVTTHYHLRDWLISRQRYWGAPIPMIYCETCAKNEKGWLTENESLLHKNHDDWGAAGWYPVSEDDLPVLLPDVEDYKPKGDGRGPLASHKDFYETTCPACGGAATRETDVCDTFLDSSWYFLRYPSTDSVTNKTEPFDAKVTKEWLPVNLYFGGAEHSVLHLMYARFVTQVLFDLKHVPFEEPFPHFYAHGLMIKDGAKMSKSRGNVVNPDTYIDKFGADTMRLYLMFMGPMDGSPDFRDTGIEGMERFTNRVWDLMQTYDRGVHPEDVTKVISKMHQTVKKVTEGMHVFHYNTAIASIMEYVNTLKEVRPGDSTDAWNDALKTLTLLLAPFAPHLSDEVWHTLLRNDHTVHTTTWPLFDESLIVNDTVTIAIQVNGKLRSQIVIPSAEGLNESFVVEKARADEATQKWVTHDPKKTIFVPNKLVNFVI